MFNSRPELSNYRRKQMTIEELDHYENTDCDGNYLIESTEYASYTFNILEAPEPDEFGYKYLIEQDYTAFIEDSCESIDEAKDIIRQLIENIQQEEYEADEIKWD